MICILMQIMKYFLRDIIIGRSKKGGNSGYMARVLVKMIDNVNQNEYNMRYKKIILTWFILGE